MTIFATIAAAALAAILCIWFGYPLLVWFVALLVRRPNRPNAERGSTRRVSVIVATREQATAARERIANLLDTAHPAKNLEVIVALDAVGSLATLADFTGVDPRVRAVPGDMPGGKAATLNAGVREATGDVLVMADTAQRFDRETIPCLVAALEDERFGAISGALQLGGDRGRLSPAHVYWEIEKWLRWNESRVHSAIGVTGAVYATRRALWPVIPAGTLLDDVYVPMSLVLCGHRVGFERSAHAYDTRVFDAGGERVRKERTLTGVLQLLTLLPGIVGVRNPVVVQFFLHKLVRLATPLLLVTAVVCGAAWAALLGVEYPQPVMAGIVGVGSAVFLVPALRRRAVTTWQWGFEIQRATVRAVMNGLRGRWSVWNKSK